MDFEFPEQLAEVQKLARDFSEKKIAPSAAKDDKEHLSPSLFVQGRVTNVPSTIVRRLRRSPLLPTRGASIQALWRCPCAARL
jgi:hypothetical protein